jgi:hypothetical protein
LLLPVTAAAAAVVLLWALRTPVLKNGPTTSGTMGAQQNSVRVLVGEGADAVEVRSLGTAQGFRLEIAAGASGGSIELAVTGGGARMNHSPDGEVSASETLRREFQAAERWSVFGWTTAHEIPLRIVVRHPDGREASRRIEVKARRGPGPGG